MAAIRAKIRIREGPPNVRREHVDLFIGALDDLNLAKQLPFLGLNYTDDLEETLQSYERSANQVKKSPMEPNQFRPRAGFATDPAPSNPARAVRAIRVENSESNGSDPVDQKWKRIDVEYMRSYPSITRRSREFVVISKAMMTLGMDPIMAIDLMCVTNMVTHAT